MLAKARGELIQKDLVTRQASFLLLSMRQKLLNFPAAYARRILNLAECQPSQWHPERDDAFPFERDQGVAAKGRQS